MSNNMFSYRASKLGYAMYMDKYCYTNKLK